GATPSPIAYSTRSYNSCDEAMVLLDSSAGSSCQAAASHRAARAGYIAGTGRLLCVVGAATADPRAPARRWPPCRYAIFPAECGALCVARGCRYDRVDQKLRCRGGEFSRFNSDV